MTQNSGEVAVAPVRVVGEDDVARAEVLRPDLGDRVRDQMNCRADHGKRTRACCGHLPLAVEHEAREVERLVEHRRVARSHHRDAHLTAGRDRGGSDDLEQERVSCERLIGLRIGGAARDILAPSLDGDVEVAVLVDAGLAAWRQWVIASTCPRSRPRDGELGRKLLTAVEGVSTGASSPLKTTAGGRSAPAPAPPRRVGARARGACRGPRAKVRISSSSPGR